MINDLCAIAAQKWPIRMLLKWARQNDTNGITYTCSKAAENGHLDSIKMGSRK